MYEYGFQNYKKYKILDKNKFKIDDNYYKDKIYIKEDFYYPLTELEKEKVKVLVKLTKLEDYKSDEEIGEVIVNLGNEEIFKEKVYVSLKEKSKKNIFIRLKEWLFN